MDKAKALEITLSYRSSGNRTKSYVVRFAGTEELKVIEAEARRDGMGKDDWLEDALNWAYREGQLSKMSLADRIWGDD